MTIIHNYLRKQLLFLLSSSLALFFLSSCQKQPNLTTFGSSFADNNNSANIVVVDSSTILMSTAFVDSTATAATGYLMVGSYNDAYLGRVNTRSFFQVAIPVLPKLTLFDSYDSMVLLTHFKKANPYYGDTTTIQGIMVSQVDSLYQLAPFQKGWFSNYQLPVNPNPLGSIQIGIAPNIPYTTQAQLDTVKIRLDDGLGKSIYNMIFNNSDTIRTASIFQRWFNGLCIAPIPNSQGAIYGFADTSTFMRIYYREAGAVTSLEKFIDFTVTNSSNQFNNITEDWTGSPIQNLLRPTQVVQPPPLTPSSQTGHASYVQTIGGLNVKLTFPYLNNIALRQDYIGLLRATLTVHPVAGSFSPIWRLPPQLGVYLSDQNNTLLAPVPAAGSAGAQTGALVLNYFNPLATMYTYDVTTFIKSQIINSSPTALQTGLMLSVPAPANTTTFNRLVIADQTYPINQRITLNVYYISLFPHQ